MNKQDRKLIEAVIQKIDEAKELLEPIIEALDVRASNCEEKFPDKSEKLQDESYSVQELRDALETLISDAQIIIEPN